MISLVLATIERTNELVRFLDSLRGQKYKNFEVIIVDQNSDERVDHIIEIGDFQFTINVVKCEKGLSKARNIGLKYIKGSIVCFPDDDCWYEDGTLQLVHDYFENNKDIDVLCGRFTNEYGESEGAWPGRTLKVNRYNVWKCAISFTIFCKSNILESSNNFDETLGVGANSKYQSGEETDFLIKNLSGGAVIIYYPDLVLRHPVKGVVFNDESIARAKKYAPGMGRVLRKNNYPIVFVFYVLLKSFLNILYSIILLDGQRIKYYKTIFVGRFQGWL